MNKSCYRLGTKNFEKGLGNQPRSRLVNLTIVFNYLTIGPGRGKTVLLKTVLLVTAPII